MKHPEIERPFHKFSAGYWWVIGPDDQPYGPFENEVMALEAKRTLFLGGKQHALEVERTLTRWVWEDSVMGHWRNPPPPAPEAKAYWSAVADVFAGFGIFVAGVLFGAYLF